jgi:hypothetical protein
MRMAGLAAGLLLLAGCTPAPRQAACAFPNTAPMLVAQLYFGRGNVSDGAWASYAEDILTPHFPDGFTVLDGAGQWREAPGSPIGREASKLVIVATDDTPAAQDRLQQVMATYRSRFNQKSVGLILERACASF